MLCYNTVMKLRGFTVVEVVVAVAIVTLLAAIVIPDLWVAQQRITGEMFMNNVHDITTTLELYKKEHSGLYPTQLEELASYFDKQPINQYTRSSMLSSNTYQSGVQYTPSADRKSYTLVVTQRDVNDLDRDKNKTETVAEALGQPFSFVNVQTITPTVARTYIVTLRAVPDNTGHLVAFPNPAKAGQTVMLSQIPTSCYNFSSWSSSDVAINNNSFTMPANDVTVTASYTFKTYPIFVASNDPSYGTVTGSRTYNCGSTATLTASANPGYIFIGWYENGSQMSTATTYIFAVTGTRTLEARFITITFTRNSVAYTSDGAQVAVNQPRFEQGKFGKAIMIEEGTTNFFTNSRLLNNGSGWTPLSANAWVDSSGEYPYIHCEAQWDGVYQNLSLSATTYTLTYLVKHKAGSNTIGSHFDGSPSMKIRVDSGAWVDGNIITVPSDGNWHLVEIQATYTQAGSYRVFLQPGRGVTEVSEFYFKYAQIEQKPYATSFIDGTRAAETLTIPTAGVLNPQQGTIEVWVYVPDFWKPGIPYWRRIWGIGRGAGAGMYWLGYDPVAGKITFSIYNNAGTAQTITANKPAVGWHLFTARWSASEMSLWIDGVKMGSKTSPSLPTNFADTTLAIGCRSDSPYDNVNTLIDDFRVSNRARTDAEILSLYQSGQPAPKDADTTLKLTFDGNLTP